MARHKLWICFDWTSMHHPNYTSFKPFLSLWFSLFTKLHMVLVRCEYYTERKHMECLAFIILQRAIKMQIYIEKYSSRIKRKPRPRFHQLLIGTTCLCSNTVIRVTLFLHTCVSFSEWESSKLETEQSY